MDFSTVGCGYLRKDDMIIAYSCIFFQLKLWIFMLKKECFLASLLLVSMRHSTTIAALQSRFQLQSRFLFDFSFPCWYLVVCFAVEDKFMFCDKIRDWNYFQVLELCVTNMKHHLMYLLKLIGSYILSFWRVMLKMSDVKWMKQFNLVM